MGESPGVIPIQLPHEFMWRGYRFRKKDDQLVCVHRDVTMTLSVDPKQQTVLVACIKSHTFAGYVEGDTEGRALASCLMVLRNTLKVEIKDGKQAEKNLERLRSMF